MNCNEEHNYDTLDFSNNNSQTIEPSKGLFLIIEGCDSSGKTTVCKGLGAFFIEKYRHVFITTEPTLLTKFGRILRAQGNEKRLEKEMEIEYFFKDRLFHVQNIISPLLSNGIHVISDRYYPSTVAYQSSNIDDVTKLYDEYSKKFLKPDATFILDVPYDEIQYRLINRREKRTAYEADLKYACEVYQHLKDDNLYHIDGRKKPHQVLDDILLILHDREYL